MKNIFLSVLLLIIAVTMAVAQDTAPLKNDNILRKKVNLQGDSGNTANNLSFSFVPAYFKIGKGYDGAIVHLGNNYVSDLFALGASYRWKNKIELSVSSAFIDYKKDKFEVATPPGGKVKREETNIQATYYFPYLKLRKVRIDNETNKKSSYQNVISYHELYLPGIRAGFYSCNNIVSNDEATFYGYNIYDKTRQVRSVYIDNYSANVYMAWVNIGFSFSHISGTQFKLGPLNVKERKYISTFYADLIYAPYIRYSNIVGRGYDTNGNLVSVDYKTDDNTPKHRYGMRIGYQYKKDTRIGWGFGAEGGIMPGPALNPYIALKLLLPVFNFKV